MEMKPPPAAAVHSSANFESPIGGGGQTQAHTRVPPYHPNTGGVFFYPQKTQNSAFCCDVLRFSAFFVMQRNAECEMQRIKRTAFGHRKAQKRDAERKKNSSPGYRRSPTLDPTPGTQRFVPATFVRLPNKLVVGLAVELVRAPLDKEESADPEVPGAWIYQSLDSLEPGSSEDPPDLTCRSNCSPQNRREETSERESCESVSVSFVDVYTCICDHSVSQIFPQQIPDSTNTNKEQRHFSECVKLRSPAQQLVEALLLRAGPTFVDVS